MNASRRSLRSLALSDRSRNIVDSSACLPALVAGSYHPSYNGQSVPCFARTGGGLPRRQRALARGAEHGLPNESEHMTADSIVVVGAAGTQARAMLQYLSRAMDLTGLVAVDLYWPDDVRTEVEKLGVEIIRGNVLADDRDRLLNRQPATTLAREPGRSVLRHRDIAVGARARIGRGLPRYLRRRGRHRALALIGRGRPKQRHTRPDRHGIVPRNHQHLDSHSPRCIGHAGTGHGRPRMDGGSLRHDPKQHSTMSCTVTPLPCRARWASPNGTSSSLATWTFRLRWDDNSPSGWDIRSRSLYPTLPVCPKPSTGEGLLRMSMRTSPGP